MAQEYHKNRGKNNLQESGQLLDSNRITSSQTNPSSFDPLPLEQMKVILESSPAGIGVVKGRVLGWANENFYEMLGYETGSLVGKNVRILHPNQTEYDKAGKTLTAGMEKYNVGVV
ncbi:MAG: PAS domain-containing protein, partial [Desulfobacteraceae bacterium]|nr:PAS domain-containing protein [Desulfobacteraceae bacterium]